MEDVNSILLPLDGSPVGLCGLEAARSLAKRYGAEVVVFGCTNLNEVSRAKVGMNENDFVTAIKDAKKSLTEHLEGVVKELMAEGIPALSMHRTGRPSEQILAACESEGIGLVVMASRGRGGLERLLLGSVAEAVLRQAPCPVLIAPARGADLTVPARSLFAGTAESSGD